MNLSLVKGDEQSDTLADVSVPLKYYNRIRTGVDILDLLFGSELMPGILPGSCILVTGEPGAGKTTFMLQLADLLVRTAGRELLYNANEESKPMVKLAADRIKVAGQFKISQRHAVDSLTDHVLKTGVEVLVQDSVQTLEDGQLSGNKLLKTVGRKLVRLSKDHDVTVIAIGQVTKAGDMAGPMALKHEFDAHLHLGLDHDTGLRTFMMQKNRFGEAWKPYVFELTASGVEFKSPEDPAAVKAIVGGTAQQPVSRQVERRREVKVFIREKLLAGEMVSGYCFERFQVDCSGGYWRGMLRQVVGELQRDGVNVGEMRVDGRLHNFVERPVA